MILLGISTQAHVIDVCLHLSPAGNQFLYKGSASQDIEDFIDQLLKESRCIRDTGGKTFQQKTQPLRITKMSSSWAARVRCRCQKPRRLSILVLNRHLAILSRVFSMWRILPEWFWVFLLTSP